MLIDLWNYDEKFEVYESLMSELIQHIWSQLYPGIIFTMINLRKYRIVCGLKIPQLLSVKPFRVILFVFRRALAMLSDQL